MGMNIILNLAVRVTESCFILGWLYSCTGTSIGLQTNNQEIVQVIRMVGRPGLM
jgi:hypothetical protein